MECLCHLRRIIGASQRATGNEGFDVDLLKQRQVSGGDTASDGKL